MINASTEFREKLRDGAEVQTYADITLSNGTVLHLTPDDIWLGGCTIDDKTTDGKFGAGFVIGKTLSLRIANHDERFSVYDFYNSIITLYVAMQLDDGTIEKIRKGIYYTTVPETPGDIIEISAADGMYRLDRDYANSGTVYPASLQTIITEACLDCGIPIGFTQFDNMSFVAQEKPEKATYRQVVSWACQIAGYNARIDNNGYMQLVWYNTALLDSKVYDGGDFLTYPHDTELDGGDFFDYGAVKIIDGGLFTDAHPEHIFRFKSLTVHTDDVVITGVQVVHEDTDVLFGETGYVIKVENNPFVAGKENQVANYLGQRMVGMYFRPFSCSVLGNPLYEPFDVCKVSDRKGNAYKSIINSVSYTVGSYTEIACQTEDPVRNGSSYFSEAAAAVVEARRNTQKQLTEYDKAVQNMNQIAMNAMGYHTTFEDQPDGSRITYLHDKPNLSDSTIIYKQTIDGFFVSQDGGKSYTAGFDSQGNAVVNILYAIGIVADWIRTGRLVIRNAKEEITMLADADTGEIRISADFLEIKGKTVQDISSEAADDAIDKQTQEDVFNKLTNNGQAKGIYLQDEQLYILFDYAKGGTLTLGGLNNTNGSLRILDSSGKEVVSGNKDGIFAIKGKIGGFTIDPTQIIGGNPDIGIMAIQLPSSGMKWALAIGANSYESYAKAPFRVSKNGEFYAEKGTISGSIAAGSVYIANDYVTSTNDDGSKCYMTSGALYFTNKNGKQTISISGGDYGDNGALFVSDSEGKLVSSFSSTGASLGGTVVTLGTSDTAAVTLSSIITSSKLATFGSLVVTGAKTRAVKTKRYGTVLQYCYEMPSPMFGDIGTGKTDFSGCAYIYFDQIFQETVTSDMTYYVFLQKEGQGDLWIEEKTPEYFLVKGTPELSFSWEVKVKQRDYEYERLDVMSESEEEKEIDYEAQAETYLNEYEKEILTYEENN